MMHITLNFETKKIFDNNDIKKFLLSYFSNVDIIVKCYNEYATNNVNYYMEISSDIDMQDIPIVLHDIRLLCKFFEQNAIACVISHCGNDFIDFQGKIMICDTTEGNKYLPFKDEFFYDRQKMLDTVITCIYNNKQYD